MTLQNRLLATSTASAGHAPNHPLSSLSAAEIETAARLVKELAPGRTDWQFKAITLEEPPKKTLIPYLEAEHEGRNPPKIKRQAFVAYYLRTTVTLSPKPDVGGGSDVSTQARLYEAIVNLSDCAVEHNAVVGSQHHAPADADEIEAVEKAVLNDEQVRAELRKLQLPQDTQFVCDPWIYGERSS